jgi:hypothetical protein
VERLAARLGNSGLFQLAKYIQANREAALLVYETGEPGAIGLYEAKGDVAGARAWMAKAVRGRPGGARRRQRAQPWQRPRLARESG